ncbi:MAG: CopG family transcriptional regulator [Planctomycetota bacterium]
MMIRTQIQLTEDQARRLKHRATEEGRSMADLVREAVADLLARGAGPDPDERRRRARAVAGAFHSGMGDLSEQHDRHLREAYAR